MISSINNNNHHRNSPSSPISLPTNTASSNMNNNSTSTFQNNVISAINGQQQHSHKRKHHHSSTATKLLNEEDRPLSRSSSSPPLPQKEEHLQPGSNEESERQQSKTAAAMINTTSNAGLENFLEAQKAFQKLTSQLSGFDQRNPFHLSTLSPFLAALQQQQGIQQQLFNAGAAGNFTIPVRMDAAGSTASSSHGSDRLDEEEEEDVDTCLGAGPEDLSLCFSKEKKLDLDEAGCTAGAAASNWSYEEQFKQLYELSEEPKRKEWLDDWLSFMHRIGKPVTRIPIMAKQVLDLYELYRLVVQHGGLVEIINKKLWREITKGLNLPNSITSAAFTLRTQYQKYLYDFECHHENLSCLADLQSAIEGNRREGRRTNHSSSTPNPSNSNNSRATPMLSHSHQIITNDSSANGMHGSAANVPFPHSLLGHHSMAAVLFGKHMGAFGLKEEGIDLSVLNQQISVQHAQQALATAAGLEAVQQQRQFELLQKAAMDAGRSALGLTHNPINDHSDRNSTTSSYDSDKVEFVPPAKEPRVDITTSFPSAAAGLTTNFSSNNLEHFFKDSPSTHMKLTNARTPNGENNMVVSMEINGVMYQGVLFAIHSPSTAASPPSLNLYNAQNNNSLGAEQTPPTEGTNAGSTATEVLKSDV